ncbi:hypothetical protein ABIF61_007206 [Bradyrhizobium japonicum]
MDAWYTRLDSKLIEVPVFVQEPLGAMARRSALWLGDAPDD